MSKMPKLSELKVGTKFVVKKPFGKPKLKSKKRKSVREISQRIYFPKHSNPRGYTDEGISDNLNKPMSFRYSDLFLRRWYNDKASKFISKRRKK